MDMIYICEMCQKAYEPAEKNGVRELKMFNGYTVDLQLQQFRKMEAGTLPQFIDFISALGQEILALMHEEVMKAEDYQNKACMFFCTYLWKQAETSIEEICQQASQQYTDRKEEL